MDGKRLLTQFFETKTGNIPVLDWLRGLAKADKKSIGDDIKTVEFGWPVGMPTCRPMGDGLFEVRTDLPQNRIARVLFMIVSPVMLLLHGFIKKADKTPKADIELARARMREQVERLNLAKNARKQRK